MEQKCQCEIEYTETTGKKQREYITGHRLGKDFINWTTIVQSLRTHLTKWDLIRLKGFCKQKK